MIEKMVVKEYQVKIERYDFSIEGEEGSELARASIIIIYNKLHKRPYALLEDVFVDERMRGMGLGKKIVESAINKARQEGCYKIIANLRFERPGVHKLYESFGLEKHGYEFRLDFK